MYNECEALVLRVGSPASKGGNSAKRQMQELKRADPESLSYFPPAAELLRAAAEEAEREEEIKDDEDVEMGGVPTRKHGREDLNGTSKNGGPLPQRKKRRKGDSTPAASVRSEGRAGSADGDAMMVDEAETTSVEEVKMTNGHSRGTQVETYEISKRDCLPVPSKEKIGRCAWNPNPKMKSLLAVSSKETHAQIWEIGENARLLNVNGLTNGERQTRSGRTTRSSREDLASLAQSLPGIMVLEWNAEGSLLAIGSPNGQTIIRGVDGRDRCILSMKFGQVLYLRWSASGTRLLSVHVDNNLCVWNVETGQNLATRKGNFSNFTMCAEDLVAAGTESGNVQLFTLKDRELEPLATLRGHEGDVDKLEWDPITHRLATAAQDGKVVVWKQNSWKTPEWTIKSPSKSSEFSVEVCAVAWQPMERAQLPINGATKVKGERARILAVGYTDASLVLYDVETQTTVRKLELPSQAEEVRFSPDGKLVAVVNAMGQVVVYSVGEGVPRLVYPAEGEVGDEGEVGISWGRDGERLAVCEGGNCAVVGLPKGLGERSES